MSTWQTITSGNLNDAKAAQLITAVRTTCLASGQSDPVPNLISQVVNELRSAIGFSGKYLISATESTLPPNLIEVAVQKIVRSCKRRLDQQLTLEERDDETAYKDKLKALTRGEWPVDAPDDPVTSNPSNPSSSRVSLQTNNMNTGDDAVANRPFARNMTANL